MEFNACVKHKVVRHSVRDFAEKELRPIAAEIDHKARFPWEVMEKMGPLKYFGLQAPLEMGGAGLDTISYAIAIEEISRVSAGVGLCLTVHNSVAVYPILAFGTKEQKERFLPDLISGRRIGSFCLTEAGAGSDAGAVETLATEQDDGFLVNGAKIFVTNGGVCGLALIFAKNSADDPRAGASVLMIEKERAGYSVGEIEDLMGMRCNPVASLFLEDCLVPKENLLGKPGQGIRIGLMTLDTGRLGVAAQALGIAQAAFEASLKYAKERRQFGKPISSFQTVQNYLADMSTEIDAARLLLYRACAMKDSGRPFSGPASKAKLYCSKTAREVTNLALQIHGGCGYSKEYDVERYMREAKVTEIYEGTSEIQRMVIARDILKAPL